MSLRWWGRRSGRVERRAGPAQGRQALAHALGTDICAHEVNDRRERRAGAEVALDAHRLDSGDVLIGQDAARHDQHIVHAILTEQVHHLGEDRHMRAREDAHQDGVHILLDGGFDDHRRRLADAGIDHFHASVAQRPRDHLGAPVVSIEARLGHQHPNSAFVGHI